ncbi:DUF5325 family protein [Thalassobacillus hwangdonensis]|uniref:DUF5325 family protein n=1 Tax=Thalassobacillus hwangdonensis TaxID=546108 RepID=A0ABW3KWU8_9BACI
MNIKMAALAFLVILCFIALGFAIGIRSVWLGILFTLLGFGLMGYGISLKKRQQS